MRTKDTTKHEIICKRCSQPFYVTKYIFDLGKKYCSVECRWPNVELKPRKNEQRNVEVTCKHCQKKFEVKEHLARKRQFCNNDCSNEYRKKALKDVRCIGCKTIFKVKQSAIKQGRQYCTQECYLKHKTDKPRNFKRSEKEQEPAKRQHWAKPLPLFGLPK